MNRDIMSRFTHAAILCFEFGLMLHTSFSFSRETCNYIKYYKSSYTILLLLIITYYQQRNQICFQIAWSICKCLKRDYLFNNDIYLKNIYVVSFLDMFMIFRFNVYLSNFSICIVKHHVIAKLNTTYPHWNLPQRTTLNFNFDFKLKTLILISRLLHYQFFILD